MKLTEVQNLRSELQKWRLEILRRLIFCVSNQKITFAVVYFKFFKRVQFSKGFKTLGELLGLLNIDIF